MSYQDKHFEQQLKVPAIWAIVGLTGIGIVLTFLLLLGDHRADLTSQAYGARAALDSGTSLPGRVLSVPAHVVGDSGNWLGDFWFAADENRRLKHKVAELSQFKDLYDQEHVRSLRYERLLKLRTEPPVEWVTARSVLVSRGPFSNNRLIDAGSDKGIHFGNPVITEHGLVGRIVGVTGHVSRILMITDVISRVPVMVNRSDARAMLVGDGGDFPRLEFVRGQDSVRRGDQILSSGDGGIFPRGLPVGEAVQGVDGIWHAKLYANQAPIDLVKVLLFEDFSQLPNADEVLKSPDVSHVLPAPPVPQPMVSASVSASSAPSISAAVPKPMANSTLTNASRASNTGGHKSSATSLTKSPNAKPVGHGSISSVSATSAAPTSQ